MNKLAEQAAKVRHESYFKDNASQMVSCRPRKRRVDESNEHRMAVCHEVSTRFSLLRRLPIAASMPPIVGQRVVVASHPVAH